MCSIEGCFVELLLLLRFLNFVSFLFSVNDCVGVGGGGWVFVFFVIVVGCLFGILFINGVVIIGMVVILVGVGVVVVKV